MSKPKRHHWWPIAQSKHWTDPKRFVFVTRSDGTVFPTTPLNIGVESELYTRFGEEDTKDTGIEDWFATTIDGPITKTIEHLLNPQNVQRGILAGVNPTKVKTAKTLGYRVNSYIDRVYLPSEIRAAVAAYIAALLVRHPTYLAKLVQFHQDDASSRSDAKNLALDKMIELYRLYAEKIGKSVMMVSRRVGDAEYLYADGGLMFDEPWRTAYDIPFDIHAPLTPDLAIEVLPIPHSADLATALVMEAANRGVSRLNRIILAGAKRFVFSRQMPPVEFIVKHFGEPAPRNIGYWTEGGKVRACYDPARQ